MGLDINLPFEGAGSAIKGLFSNSNGTTKSEGSAESGFLAFLKKIAPDNGTEALGTEAVKPSELGANGNFAGFPGFAPLVGTPTNIGVAPEKLTGEFIGLDQVKSSPGLGLRIAPPLDGALPIAGDNAENGARLFGQSGNAFERYLANSSVGTGQLPATQAQGPLVQGPLVQGLGPQVQGAQNPSPQIQVSEASGPQVPSTDSLAGLLDKAGDALPSAVGDALRARPIPPSFALALETIRLTGGQASASGSSNVAVPSDVVEGLNALNGGANPSNDGTISGALQAGRTNGSAGALFGGDGQNTAAANTNSGIASARSGTTPAEPVAGLQGASVQAGRSANTSSNSSAGANQAVNIDSLAARSAFAEADGDLLAGHRNAAAPGSSNSGSGSPHGFGSNTGSASGSSTQSALKSGVSPAAEKFAAIIGNTQPGPVSANGADTVPGVLPGEGVLSKVENGFATLGPQNTPESSQARSLSPAIISAAAGIARGAAQGDKNFTIRLDPPELGRVDVRLKISDDGIARAHLIVERSETLDLFLRDQRSLERSLEQAGVKTDGSSLQFSLEGGERGASFAQSDADGRPGGPRAGDADGPAVETAREEVTQRRHDGQLNITI